MKSLPTRIIILDDDNFDNSLSMLSFKRMLNCIELDIIGFTDPRAGLQHIETELPKQLVNTIVLLDISMPYLNGWEVLQKLEQMPPDIAKYLSVYILSNSTDKDDVQKSEESPLVKAYLVKPITDHLAYLFESILEEELSDVTRKEHDFFNKKK